MFVVMEFLTIKYQTKVHSDVLQETNLNDAIAAKQCFQLLLAIIIH